MNDIKITFKQINLKLKLIKKLGYKVYLIAIKSIRLAFVFKKLLVQTAA